MVNRRRFLALSGAAVTFLLAGCSTDSYQGTMGPGTGNDGDGDGAADPNGGIAESGTFRLLISDQPVAIDEFDSLPVTFDRAQIFRSGGDGEESDEYTSTPPAETQSENATQNGTSGQTSDGNDTSNVTTTNATANGTSTSASTPNGTVDGAGTPSPGGDGGNGDQEGFSEIDLDGQTVDLTKVVGDKAVSVYEGDLAAGRYTKIELYADEVHGFVDGVEVEVKIPSGKLKIIKPFEVGAGESLSFVFDITVVKKGKAGGYNLQPVIGESGVAGKDVDVEEIESENDGGEADDGETETNNETPQADNANKNESDGGNGPPANSGPSNDGNSS